MEKSDKERLLSAFDRMDARARAEAVLLLERLAAKYPQPPVLRLVSCDAGKL